MHPKTLLLYPPEQNWPDTMCKPNGSLAYPYLGASLIEAGFPAEVYDACVGDEKDKLEEVFYKSTKLPSGLYRTGVSDERILEKVSGFDIIGITSIFSSQETMVLDIAKKIKKEFPEKLIISGGVNARYRMNKFFDNGIDLICTSEAEKTIVDIAKAYSKKDYSDIPYLAFLKNNEIFFTGSGSISMNLDELPMPRWDLLPNERYWKINRPHGGHFSEGEEVRYASLMTSRGCPFECSYCHVAGELENSVSGEIGRFRIKSDERVLKELDELKKLNVKQVFIEDDSLFGRKKRGINLLKKIRDYGFGIRDVNGVNIVHMLKKGEPDYEVLDALAESGFKEFVLAFESANPRIIKKYASNKWDITNSNISGLIKSCYDRNLQVAGNFMIGYPDETREEIQNTINYAHFCMDSGMNYANFFLVMPLPGTPLFDWAVKNGNLPEEFNPDKMHWHRANMKNTIVSSEELENTRRDAWEKINKENYLSRKKSQSIEIL